MRCSFWILMIAIVFSLAHSTVHAEDYEPTPILLASNILPEPFLSGPSFRVIQSVTGEGMLYSFSIWSTYGWFYPQCEDYLRVRVAEISAMDTLRKVQEKTLFLEGLTDRGEDSVRKTGDILTRPIQSLEEVPLGLQKFGNRSGKVREEIDPWVVGGIDDQAKRRIALVLGVDPYTNNFRLQEMLNTLAKNRNREKLTANLGALITPGITGIALDAAHVDKSLQEILFHHSSAELHELNRESLAEISISDKDISMFLAHPAYTPTLQSGVRIALEGLAQVEGIEGYLSSILEAHRPEVAQIHCRRLQMAESFHRNIRPLKTMEIKGSTPVFTDEDDQPVIFLNVDYLYWNEALHRGLLEVFGEEGGRGGDIIITGGTSPTAEEKLTGLGLDLFQFKE